MSMNKQKLTDDALMRRESRFVSETAAGITIDNSEAEGEPFDLSVEEDDDGQ